MNTLIAWMRRKTALIGAVLLLVSLAPDAARSLTLTPSPADTDFQNWISQPWSDGRQLVSAWAYWPSSNPPPNPPHFAFGVWGLNADGTPDSSFAGSGFVSVPIWGEYEGVAAMALQPDGKIVVLGNANDPVQSRRESYCDPDSEWCFNYVALTRLNPDGSVDPAFNGNGKLVFAIGVDAPYAGEQLDGNQFDFAGNLKVQSDGKIVVSDTHNAEVARANPDGTFDTSFVPVAQAGSGAPAPAVHEFLFADAQGLWYNPDEPGWGLSLSQQGDTLFAIRLTYDESGRDWWLSMPAFRTGEGVYAGTLYETTGPGLQTPTFDPSKVKASAVGTASISFSDREHATFSYTVHGVTQAKSIVREVFDERPACGWGILSDPAKATNYQDTWYASPAGSESGWGLSIVHQGDTIFATLAAYDVDNRPHWLFGVARSAGANAYAGTMYSSRGSAFDVASWNPAAFHATPRGEFSLTFSDGNTGVLHYQVQTGPTNTPVTANKPITREVFDVRGTTCEKR